MAPRTVAPAWRAVAVGIEGNASPSNPGAAGLAAVVVGIEGKGSPSNSIALERGPMPKITKTEKRARARDAIAGLKKHFGPGEIKQLGGKATTRDGLVAVLQEHLDALAAVDAATVALRVAVARESALDRRVRALVRLLQHLVVSRLGADHAIFGDFGWKVPKKPGPKTVAAKAEGARKAELTRAARGTKPRRRRR
jgi:hypothetical protein